MVFELDFAKSTVLSSFLFFFLNFDVYLLIPPAIAQILNPIAELVMSIEIPSHGVKAEIKTHLVIAKAKTRQYSI